MEETAPSGDPLVGKVLDGRYVIERRLGAGGMGVVYAGRQTAVNRPVAIKVLPAALSEDQIGVRRFMQEAQASSRLAHPHVVTIHDFGQTADGILYLVMELLSGETLRDVLRRTGAMPIERAVRVATMMLDAMGDAHANGIVHRDLKSDNVMLVRRGSNPEFVKVLDFGLAHLAEASGSLTRTGAVFGTPAYMAPEQALGRATDPRADLYSLGIVLYEMLCGRVPFEAQTPLSLLYKHVHEPPPALPGVPPRLNDVVMRALAKFPDARYASAAEMSAALVAACDPSSATADEMAETVPPSEPPGAIISGIVSGPASSGPVRAAPGSSRWPWVAGAAVLIAGAATAWRLSGTPPQPTAAVAPPTSVAPPSEVPPPASDAPATAPLPVALTFESTPAGAAVEVVVDGATATPRRGSTPFVAELPRGASVDARFTLEGHAPVSASSQAEAPHSVSVTLQALPAAAPRPSPPRATGPRPPPPRPTSEPTAGASEAAPSRRTKAGFSDFR